MAPPASPSLLRLLSHLMLGVWLACLAAPGAFAQRQPIPEQPPTTTANHATQAELAVSDWSHADLQAWWAALRALRAGQMQAALPSHLQPPGDAGAWQPVNLPDVRQRGERRAAPAEPRYQMRWYRWRHVPAEGPAALYMPRLVTAAAAVLVRTEAGWRPVFDNQAGAREQWVRPLWAVLNEQHPAAEMDVVLAAPVLSDSLYVVSSAWFGARDALEPDYRARWHAQIGVPQATGLTLAVLAMFAMALWLRRRNEPIYLLFALAAGAWLLRNLHYYMELPRTHLGLEWFWWATHASMAWVMMLTFLFVLRFGRQRHLLFELGLAVTVLLSSLLTLPLWISVLNTPALQHGVNAVVGLIGTAFVAQVAWRERGRELLVMTASLVLGLLLGVHDLILLLGWAWPEHIYLLPFATLVTIISFLYALQGRYVGALDEVQRTNQNLVVRLKEQGEQLQSQHDMLREAERQQALMLERQRLMQDMHDGLGSSLLSAMVAVEQGSMDQDSVVTVLRECVDDLRLVIDSLEPVGHDLVSLLATMRYRLGKRLQIGGLVLEWDVQDLPPLAWLEPPDALHVLRLIQEALSNVLKHARASRVRMVTRHQGKYVEIRVEDDGEGFDMVNASKGRGLKSQQKRAARLGGQVTVDSAVGQGTRLSLILPVHRESKG